MTWLQILLTNVLLLPLYQQTLVPANSKLFAYKSFKAIKISNDKQSYHCLPSERHSSGMFPGCDSLSLWIRFLEDRVKVLEVERNIHYFLSLIFGSIEREYKIMPSLLSSFPIICRETECLRIGMHQHGTKSVINTVFTTSALGLQKCAITHNEKNGEIFQHL